MDIAEASIIMEYITEGHRNLAEYQLELIRSRFSQLEETARSRVESLFNDAGGKRTHG